MSPRTRTPIAPDFSIKRLSDATVQELQLELFRRCIAADFDLDGFIAILLANQHLWVGAVIDRLGINQLGHRLTPMSMIKLRDIDQNFWNADTLHILCPSRQAAESLVSLLDPDRFAGMPVIEENTKVIDDALGGADEGVVIVRYWWD